MENNFIVTIAVTSIAIGVGYFIYTQTMGCSNSIHADKADDKKSITSSNGEQSTSKKPAKPVENKFPGGKVHIYFGSQTGTAEGYARTIMEEGKAAGFDAKVVDLEEFDAEQLQSANIAIFLMATYGEGAPTDNAAKFAQWLINENSEVPATYLEQLKYTVFGLGNRQYEHYNKQGKLTDAGLETLGASRCFEYGEGDDDGTLEEDFDAWKSKLWPAFMSQFINKQGGDGEQTMKSMHANQYHKVNHEFRVVTLNKADFNQDKIDELRSAFITEANSQVSTKTTKSTGKAKKFHASTRHFFTAPRAKLVENRELRNTTFQAKNGEDVGSTRHIEIDIGSVHLPYFTADNLAILPENHAGLVKQLLTALKIDADALIDIQALDSDKEADFKIQFPTPCTVYELFQSYIDITSELRHSTLKSLVYYVSSPEQRKWLEELLADTNRSQFKAFVEERKPSIVDLVAYELSSLKIDLVDLLHILPSIQPRYYTISSSSSVHPNIVHATVSLTEYPVKNNRNKTNFAGLCTSFLGALKPSADSLRVFVRPSTFRLPKSLANPIIMIGPGTGIAPMRALLQEREYLLQHNTSNEKTGAFELYFGCKHQNMDYIYRDELEAYHGKNVLTGLHTAFSRDQEKKIYVQHLLLQEEHAAKIVDYVLNQSAYVFVCGATSMGHDVLSAFITILEKHGKLTKEDATKKIKEMQEHGKYVQELWSA